MTAETIFVYCPSCERECVAEAPPCPDGHGSACPDRACVECGTALLCDVAIFDPVGWTARQRATGRRVA